MNPIDPIFKATKAIKFVARDASKKYRLVLENDTIAIKTKSVFSKIADAIFGRFFGKRTTDSERLIQVLDNLDRLLTEEITIGRRVTEKKELRTELQTLSEFRNLTPTAREKIQEICNKVLPPKRQIKPKDKNVPAKAPQTKSAHEVISTVPDPERIAWLNPSQKRILMEYLDLKGSPENYKFDSFIRRLSQKSIGPGRAH